MSWQQARSIPPRNAGARTGVGVCEARKRPRSGPGGTRGRKSGSGGRSVQRSPRDTSRPQAAWPLARRSASRPAAVPRRPGPDPFRVRRPFRTPGSDRAGISRRPAGKFRDGCHGVTGWPKAGAQPWCGTRSRTAPAVGRSHGRARRAGSELIPPDKAAQRPTGGPADAPAGAGGGAFSGAQGTQPPPGGLAPCEAFSLAACGRPQTARARPVQGQASVQDARKGAYVRVQRTQAPGNRGGTGRQGA